MCTSWTTITRSTRSCCSCSMINHAIYKNHAIYAIKANAWQISTSATQKTASFIGNYLVCSIPDTRNHMTDVLRRRTHRTCSPSRPRLLPWWRPVSPCPWPSPPGPSSGSSPSSGSLLWRAAGKGPRTGEAPQRLKSALDSEQEFGSLI